MSGVERMRDLALRESAASRRAWAIGDSWHGDNCADECVVPPVIERIKPLIGSGMTQAQAAEYLGVTRGPIVKALRELGAKL